jgi:Alpha-2-macroglobulin bait region domain
MVILVESNSLMEELNVVVLAKSGLIFADNFNESRNENSFNFTLKITKEMAPIANIIVYFLSEGDFLYGHVEVKLGFVSSNYVRLS